MCVWIMMLKTSMNKSVSTVFKGPDEKARNMNMMLLNPDFMCRPENLFGEDTLYVPVGVSAGVSVGVSNDVVFVSVMLVGVVTETVIVSRSGCCARFLFRAFMVFGVRKSGIVLSQLYLEPKWLR